MSSATTPIRLKVAADLGVTAGTIGLGNVENKSSATIRSEIVAANLAGAGKPFAVLPASGATVGAAIGVNFTGQFTTANIANFFAAKVITAGIIDVTDLFAQAISVTDTVKVGSDTGRYLLTLDGRGTASPIAIIDKNNAGALVFGFDSDDKPYFGGGLRDGAIDSVNVFTDEVLTQLKPIVVGSTGGIFKVAGLPSMIGATLNKTVTVTPANPSSVLIGLSFSDYFLNIASSVNLNFTPPKYMVTIKRSLNGGTATTIHSQMYTGTALNQRDPEVNKWECSFAINVDIAISDINHAANNNDSITYTFTVTRSSGAYSAAKITAASCSQQTQGGGAAGVASQLTAPYVGLTASGSTEYPAMEIKNGPTTSNTWIRTPTTGLLPYASGGGSSNLGSASWPFATIYGQAVYDNNNRVYSASNPNIGTGSTNYAAGNHGHAYAPLTGGGTSGTWGISVTGNAATATILQTARTINGVSFNGSANITVADSTKLPLTGGTLTGTLTTRLDSASSMMSVKANATAGWSYDVMSAGTTATSGVGTVHLAYKSIAEGSVPAQSYHIRVGGGTTQFAVNASGVYSYVGLTAPTFYGALNGNADTATLLQTARTIGISGAVTGTATSFNGGANITINATAVNAANLTGTVPDARISGSYTGLTNLTGSGTVDFAKFLGNASDTVAAPSFSWTGDLDTGMYWVAADQIGIATGGVQRALFNSSGVTAATFNGALNGNASTATSATTASNSNSLGGVAAASYVKVNGNLPVNDWRVAPGHDANTTQSSSLGFTYANNAPHVGPLVTLGSREYVMQFNSRYGDGGAISWRGMNGDNKTWGAWKELYHTSNLPNFIRADQDHSFSGKLTSTSRDGGIYGTYDSTKTDHIWSMGVAYKNAADGSNFGNLFGFAYKHTNNTTGGTMGGGHQAVWVVNGTPKAAMGEGGIWTIGTTFSGAYRGVGNVGGTGEAIHCPAGIYSTGTNWLYGQIITNNNTINAGTGTINGGSINASVGVYDNANRVYSAINKPTPAALGAAPDVNSPSYAKRVVLSSGGDYVYTVILLHRISGGASDDRRFFGTLTWQRTNGLTYPVAVSVHSCKQYNSTSALGTVTYHGQGNDYGFAIVRCVYGGVTWLALQVNNSAAQGEVYVEGDWTETPIRIAYLNVNTGEVLNTEINNSIADNPLSGSVNVGHQLYENGERVYSAANTNIGAGSSNYAAGNHLHNGVYGRLDSSQTWEGINKFSTRIDLEGAGSWAYTRFLNNGTVQWDIAASVADSSGDLQFRPSGGTPNRVTISKAGLLTAPNLAVPQNGWLEFAANSSWGGVLRVGGNGRSITTALGSSIASTNGNLHIDCGTTGTLYLNYYSGNGGIIFGNGASGNVGTLSSSGSLSLVGSITANAQITGLRFAAGYDAGQSNSFSCSNWFRSSGATGWYNQTYGGGMYMSDTTWVRTYGGKKFFVENSSEDAIYTSGGVTSLGPMKAKSWGTGNVGAKVMTWDDFLPANPPAGLQGVITANWLAAGVVQAKHLQVDGISENGGVRTSFKLQPAANVPIRFSVIDGSNNLIEDIFAIDNKGNGFFKGKLSKDTVDINAIDEETRKMINPYYLTSTGGSKQELTASVAMASGALVSLPAITSNGKTNVSWKLNLGSETYSDTGSHWDFSMFQWRVDIYRGQTTTPVFSKTYNGYSSTVWEQASTKFKTTMSLNIEDLYIDTDPAAAKIFSMRVTKISGTANALSRKYFGADSPNFITNDLDTNEAGGFSWTDKETGFTVKSGSVSVPANTTLAVTYTRAFSIPYSCSATAVSLMTNEWGSASNGIMAAGGISITNHADRTTTINWIATGYTG